MTEESLETNLCAAYATLGCKLNFAETSSLRDTLARQGVRAAEKGEHADICIINTCSVTDVADHKCRQAIHRLTREHPGAFVVVMGCYAQLKPEEIAGFDGVDLVVGMEYKGEVVRYIRERMAQKKALSEGDACHEAITVPTREIATFVPSCSRGNRTRYFLKVQDGCNYYCTYCTIPIARGRSRNGSIASLVAQAEAVAREGGKEIVITGVNIGDFGRTTKETFFDLVKALDHVEGIERYRISSIEPNLLTDEIIEYCAQSRAFMPHFHIPLQSGSDDVLRLMHRRYDTALFAHKISKVKEMMPDAFIGVMSSLAHAARRTNILKMPTGLSRDWTFRSSTYSAILNARAQRHWTFPTWWTHKRNTSAANVSWHYRKRNAALSMRNMWGQSAQCFGNMRNTETG